MIRGLITVLSALKMRNFTWIFPKIFWGAHAPPHPPLEMGGLRPPPRPPPGKGGIAPPTKIASCAPGRV